MSAGDVLVVAFANPGHRGERRDPKHDTGDDPPRERDGGRVRHMLVLEEHDSRVNEPREPGDGAAGVDSAEVLEERGERDAHPEGRPLRRRFSERHGRATGRRKTFWKTLTRTQKTPRRKNSFRTAQTARTFPSVIAAPCRLPYGKWFVDARTMPTRLSVKQNVKS